MLQPLNLNVIQCFRYTGKKTSIKSCVLEGLTKNGGTINVFQEIYSTAVVWQHATQLTVVNGFHHCRRGREPHTKADHDEDVSTEEKKNAFCEDRIWLDGAGVTPVHTVNWRGGNSGKGKRETNMTLELHQVLLLSGQHCL
jgi:hypothetical protein